MGLVRRLVASLSLAALAVLAACAPAAGSPRSSGGAVAIPSTPVGERVAWIVGVLEADADTTADEWSRVLADTFAAQVAPAQVAEMVNRQIRPAAPFTVTAYQGSESEAVVTLAGSRGDPFEVAVAIDANERITGLVFRPVSAPWRPSVDMSEVEQRLRALPGEVSALVRRESPDAADLLALDDTRSAPLASAFKLYVLLAVAEAVASGDLSWDETLVLTDSDRSLPSGELQNAPTGTEVTVRAAAREMIRISDNTATDLLIRRLGRERVEAAVVRSGHAAPSANVPFLTTKNLFTLGWGDPALRAEWEAADETAKRTVLQRIDAAPLSVAVTDVTTPVWREGVDWFASARDLAAVHRALQRTGDPEVRGILTANPGVGFDVGSWPEVAFKGGSSLGVLTGSWHARDDDGRAVIVVLQLAGDDAAAVAAAARDFFHLAEDALRLAR